MQVVSSLRKPLDDFRCFLTTWGHQGAKFPYAALIITQSSHTVSYTNVTFVCFPPSFLLFCHSPSTRAANELLTKAELIKADFSLSVSIIQLTLPSRLPLTPALHLPHKGLTGTRLCFSAINWKVTHKNDGDTLPDTGLRTGRMCVSVYSMYPWVFKSLAQTKLGLLTFWRLQMNPVGVKCRLIIQQVEWVYLTLLRWHLE